MKKIIFAIFFFIFIFFSKENILANSEYFNNTINNLNLEKYDYEINKIIGNETNVKFSFSNFVKKLINGEFKNFTILNFLNYLLGIIFQEIFINSKVIKNIIIISILCAFLTALTESFKNKGVGEIGFYAGYMVIATLLIHSFNIALGIVIQTVNNISNLINSLIPLLAGVLIMSGASVSSGIFTTIIVTFLNFSAFIMNKIFVPLISAIIILNIINHITSKSVLNKLLDFLKWIATFGIRSLAIIFAFIISFQKVASPMVNSALNKTAKTAINFVPIVGDVINGTIDGIMHFVGLIKSGVGIGVVISVLIACLFPIIKLISFIIIYKITAILIEPISDRRITSCIDFIGEYTKILLSTLIIFVFLFILLVVIMLSISG